MAAVLMLRAGDSGIIEIAGKPAFHDIFHAARAAAQNINAVAIQYINSSLSHVSGQHEFDALLGKCLGDIGFAATTGW